MNKFVQRQALIRSATDKIIKYVNNTGIVDPENVSKNTGLKIEFVRNILNKNNIKENLAQTNTTSINDEDNHIHQTSQDRTNTASMNEADSHIHRNLEQAIETDKTLQKIKTNSPKLYRMRHEIIEYAKEKYDLNALSFADVQEVCAHFNYAWAKAEISYFLGYEPKSTSDIVVMMDRYYQTEIQSLRHLSPELISVKTGLLLNRVLTLLEKAPEPLTHHELRDLSAREWFKKQLQIKEDKKNRYASLLEKLQDKLHAPMSFDEMSALAKSINSTFATTKNELAVLRKAYPKVTENVLNFSDFGKYPAISFVLPTDNVDEAFIALHQALFNIFPLYKQSLGRISQKRKYDNIDVILCTFLFQKPVEMPLLNTIEDYWGKHQKYQINVYPHIIDELEGIGNLISQEDCVFKWFDQEVKSNFKKTFPVKVIIAPWEKSWENKKELRQKALNYYFLQMKNKHPQEIAYETGYTYQHILKVMNNLPEECKPLTQKEEEAYQTYFKEEIEAEILRKEKAKQVDALIQGKILDKTIIKEVVAKTGKTASYIYSRAKTLEFIFKPNVEQAELMKLKLMLNQALALVEKALSKN